ncbi:ABC transporter permease [Accumulibacter sp.]|uniref:ABC transporter permease n=1 Tax=Accumulibacter sp. TaxID=2053492 RepID=UPI0025D8E2A7|nr:ABC transporter permease [Accumulibacter sp.]MCM8624381.1 ABC transporter permease [Accumulibacter sp.]
MSKLAIIEIPEPSGGPLALGVGTPTDSQRVPVWLRRGLEASLVWVALLVAWFLAAAYLPLGKNPLIPAPPVVLEALADSLPELWEGTLSSFTILLPGFGLATVLGILSGLAVGTSGRLQDAFLPFARVAAPVPPTVYIPYAIAVLPTFKLSAIFVVFIGAFWPIFQNAVAGAHSLEQRYRDNARILGFTGFEYYRRVVFPAALPHIFSGMAVGLGFSFILLTVAELFGANAGLGRFVQYYADFGDYPRMVAGILYTGAVTFLAMTLLEAARTRALFWVK